MPLQIEIVSDHKATLGDDYVRQFSETGGTIGRSVKSDWTLPDPDNYVSGRHCTIDYQAGAYYLADISTNGVYINDEKRPIGKGNPRRLFDGDRLRMGDFRFVVTLDEGEDLAIPETSKSVDIPDHAGQQVPEVTLKSNVQLLDEEEITGHDAFRSTVFGTGDAKAFEREPGLSKTQAVPLPKIQQEKKPKIGGKQLMAAFVKGLDIDQADIHPSVNPLQLMENAGALLREFVYGASELLASRTAVRNMFKIEETMVLPQYSNPLKASEDNKESLLQLLIGKESDTLAPADAAKQVCRDLKYHHDSVVGAMTTAFLEFTEKLDPDELKSNFDGSLRTKSFFTTMNRLRYWRMYCDLYPIMTQPGTGRFPHQYGESFVRSYAKHIAEFKYMDGPAGDTMAIRSVKMLRQAFDEIEDPDEDDQELPHADQA
jgi:type VI secretion system protein ImpI